MNPLPDHVETPRLTLRTWTPDDVEALAAAVTASVDHLVPFMPWAALEPLSIDDRLKLIEGWDSDWRSGGDVVLGIFLDDLLVGGCGLHRRLGPNALEIGYWIHVDHIKQGFAKEASKALTDVAFTIDGIERVEIHHDRANAASRGVPRSLGYEFVGETQDEVTAPGEDGVECAWAVTKASWTARARRGEDAAMFDDVLAANARYREQFQDPGITGRAAKGLAVLTCIDSRIDPLALLGLTTGDAKIIRNAGARVTDDALRSLVLAANLLGVNRVCVVAHTECAMVGTTEDELRARIGELSGADTDGWEFLSSTDQIATLRQDLERITACPLLPSDLEVGAFIFDVHTGELREAPVDTGA